MSFLPVVRLWIWVSVLASAAGWILSATGQLNRGGYVVFFAVAVAALVYCRDALDWKMSGALPSWRALRRRFRRPLPCAFAVLALLVFLGGILYPPTNHTAFSYRIPRLLQWFEHGGWFWIHAPDCRINDRACGIEWMSAPLLLFLKSDRGIFLQNFIPFLLLPGLVFSVCTHLGVRARVAWCWMWLLPTGYNFLLQAGSAGNDTFPAVYLLAAIDFGCRAWRTRRVSDLWHSLLAAALLTGAKGSNLPLLFPCAIVVLPLLPLLRRRLAATALVLLLAAVVSFLPTAVLNTVHCGDWTGANIEPRNMTVKNPAVGLYGNAFQFTLQNFIPPVFPQAGWWNQHAIEILPRWFVAAIEENFHGGFFQLGELPMEDTSGLGFGVSVLLLLAVLAAFRIRNPQAFDDTRILSVPRAVRFSALLACWIALLAYCSKSGMDTAARLISPYYAVLLPSLILGAGHAAIVRRRWWRVACAIVLILAFAVLIVTPPRPLWPAQTVLSRAVAAKPGSRILGRALNVYSVYAGRSDPLAAVRDMLPRSLPVVGFLGTPDDIGISLWRPYGTRRVEYILLSDPPEMIRQKGVDYAVVSGLQLKETGTLFAAWLQQARAELIASTNIMVKVADGPQPWHIVRFQN